MINIWNPSATEPYMMTYGLGFYEYFKMCEDLGMEPVPILNCGIACQVRSGSATDEEHLVPMDKLQPYIDDALDAVPDVVTRLISGYFSCICFANSSYLSK